MRTLAVKQPAKKLVKQKQHQNQVRSLSSSPTMLQRKLSCPCGGGCPRCQEEALMQTKSKANTQGDKYEPKANRFAEKVMQMPEPQVQRQVKPEEKGGGNSCEVSITLVESLVFKQFGNTNLTWAGQIRSSIFGSGILTVRSSVLELWGRHKRVKSR